MVTRLALLASYLALFPGLGLFYFGLMLVGDINLGGFRVRGLRPFGGPSLANLVEIPIAGMLGVIALAFLLFNQSRGRLEDGQSLTRFVASVYAIAVGMYFLMPSLPE